VPKRPPSFRKWLEQRPRQAYEDFALRTKTALFFTLPLFALAATASFGWKGIAMCLALVVLGPIALAFTGLLRGKARQHFPWSVSFSAPLWVLERAASTYWALYWHLARGGYPFGDKILSKGIGRDWIAGGRVAARAAARQPNE
jgi:hypothetical protein